MTWEGLNPPYSTIVADPPWLLDSPYASKAAASKHYSTLSTADVCALPVQELAAERCHLWLWCTNATMEGGFQVMRAWGFKPVTLVTWCKPQPGVGHYVRNNTEHILFGTYGKPMTPEKAPLSSWYVWPRAAHSVKPAAAYDLFENVSPGPYVDLFCRSPRFGWDSWGKGYESGVS